MIDIQAAIVRHPLAAIVTAAAVGAAIAVAERSRSVVMRMAATAAGGAIFSIVREQMWRELRAQAWSWIDLNGRDRTATNRAPTAAS